MGRRDNDALDNLSQYFSKDPDAFSIFEEEIDIEVQKEFYILLELLTKEYETKDNDSLNDIDKLFDEKVSVEKKKLILVLLSNLYDVSAYRAIEDFMKNGDKSLNKWAVVAHQQSRMMIEGALMDEKSIFISTGLGGKDNKLRYFCVLFTQNLTPLTYNEKEIVCKEVNFSFDKTDSILEAIEYTLGIITLKVLIPINTNIKVLFDNIIQEINCQGDILKDNIIITNVKALSIKDIDTLLKQKSEE